MFNVIQDLSYLRLFKLKCFYLNDFIIQIKFNEK